MNPGQNLVLTVLNVPCSLDGGKWDQIGLGAADFRVLTAVMQGGSLQGCLAHEHEKAPAPLGSP